MGKFFAALVLLVSFRASIWATEVEFDLSYYKTTSRSYNFEEGSVVDITDSDGSTLTLLPIEDVKGNSSFGIKQNITIFFGNQTSNLVAVGLAINHGFDFGTTFRMNGSKVTASDRLAMGTYIVLGPSLRIKPVKFLSLHVQPALGLDTFFTTDERNRCDFIYDVVNFTFNCDIGAKLWLTKHFGFNAGVNFSTPIAGGFFYHADDRHDNTLEGSCLDLENGFTYRLYLGVSWGWGKR